MTDHRDRFDPMTGQPLDAPPAGDGIAPPGSVHPDYDRAAIRSDVPTEPRDHVLQAVQLQGPISLAQRMAARQRERARSWIEITLPDATAEAQERGEPPVVVKALPRPFDDVLKLVGWPSFVTQSAQRSLMDAIERSDAIQDRDRMQLDDDPKRIIEAIGLRGGTDFYRVLAHTYPIACLVEPRCVEYAHEITDPDHEIALEWLSSDDRAVIFNACMGERNARLAAVAPFPDPARAV